MAINKEKIRLTISMSKKAYEIISQFAKGCNLSKSELLEGGTLAFIEGIVKEKQEEKLY